MKDVNIILGERVKQGRKKYNITRERLAEMVDVSPRFLAEVESGKVGVSLQTLKNISLALMTSTDYLLGINNDYNISQLEMINNQLENLNEKFYPIISSIISQLQNL